MEKQEAINLIPKAYSDNRGKWFADIIWGETQTGNFEWGKEDDAYLLRAIAAFAPTIAPFAARLPRSQQRLLLKELPELLRLAGTNYSIIRPLEIFGYTAILDENTGGNAGTFEVKIVQQFSLEETGAIVRFFMPAGRVLTAIKSTVAILLDGTRNFDGTTTL